MSTAAEERPLQPAPPPVEPTEDPEDDRPTIVRVLRAGGRAELPVQRDFALDEEIVVSFKDSDGHFIGAKRAFRVAEIVDRSMTRTGTPPWIKRIYVLKLAPSA